MLNKIGLSEELTYVLLVFSLFVIPKLLERLRIPAAIVALILGAVAHLGFGLFHDDETIKLLSTFGIAALFLFAGLEVDFREIRRERKMIFQHLMIGLLLFIGIAWGINSSLSVEPVAAALFALALISPSCGFIFDSIESMGLTEEQKFWVKTKAISVEIIALATMFVAVQWSKSLPDLLLSALAVVAIVVLLPVVFRVFAKLILPYAPNSEFAFFLMLAILCGLLTKKLGAYYLVGAFIVGISAQRFRKIFPTLDIEKTIHSLKLFTSFFTPFYFFNAGLMIPREALSWKALIIALVLLFTITPVRLLTVVFHRKFLLRERYRLSKPVAYALLPNLVFGLVLANILWQQFQIEETYLGAIIIYTVLLSLIPGFVLKGAASRDIFRPLYDYRQRQLDRGSSLQENSASRSR